MSCRVHQPGGVKGENVSEDVKAEGVDPRFVPQQNWNWNGQRKANQRHEDEIVFMLESDYGIGIQIGNVQFLSLFDDVGVFSAQKPTHMREKETTFSVMWIGIGFGVFVMDSVIS